MPLIYKFFGRAVCNQTLRKLLYLNGNLKIGKV